MAEPYVNYTIKELLFKLDIKMDDHHKIVSDRLQSLENDFNNHKATPHEGAVSWRGFLATLLPFGGFVVAVVKLMS